MANSKRAIVFVNGSCNSAICKQANISGGDLIVCVDGGLRHAHQANLKADLLVGDMDSLTRGELALVNSEQTESVSFPPEKDASDLELTLRHLSEMNLQEVIVLGLSGGRTDHMLFNWQLLASTHWPFALTAIDDTVRASVVDADHSLNLATEPGRLFSVIAPAGDIGGLSVEGAKYPLHNAEMRPGQTLGLSNETTGSRLRVSVTKGLVLVMLVYEHD